MRKMVSQTNRPEQQGSHLLYYILDCKERSLCYWGTRLIKQMSPLWRTGRVGPPGFGNTGTTLQPCNPFAAAEASRPAGVYFAKSGRTTSTMPGPLIDIKKEQCIKAHTRGRVYFYLLPRSLRDNPGRFLFDLPLVSVIARWTAFLR